MQHQQFSEKQQQQPAQYSSHDLKNVTETLQEQNQKMVNLAKNSKKIQSRSTKFKCNYEISFETSLLDNHKKAFMFFMSQYAQKILSITPEINSKVVRFFQQKQKKQILQQNNKFHTIQNIIEGFPGLTKEKKLQIILDFQAQQDLSAFLLFIVEKIGVQFSRQFIHITCIIWQKYLQSRKINKWEGVLSRIHISLQRQISEWYESKYLNELSINNFQSTQIKKGFRKMCNKYTDTIYYIIQGYFENPWYEEQKIEEQSGSYSILNRINDWSQWFDIDSYDQLSQQSKSPTKRWKYESN